MCHATGSPASTLSPTTAPDTPADADMEFSRRDLEDIQRVAGLLNLTVDELLQQSRAHSETTPQPPSPPEASPHLQESAVFVPEDLVIPGQDHRHHHPHHDASYHDADSDLVYLDDGGLQSGSSQSGFADLSYPSSAVHDQASTEVILLNPHTAWYDCDAPFDWDPNQPPVEGLNLGGSIHTGEGLYAPETEMEIDTEVASDYTARDQNQTPALAFSQAFGHENVMGDWYTVLSPPKGSAELEAPAVLESPISAASGSTGGQYHRIAPRLAKKSSPLTSETMSRTKKKRGRYEGSKRVATHLTRQLHACVRCRMQRNRCIPDPTNPHGPCLTCQQRTVRMSRLPCLRYMVTDSTLFRTSLNYMAFYRTHPMIGPHYGDFHIDRQWTNAASKFLCLGQVGSLHLKVELREFVPPPNSTDVDLKGRPMYAVPWAIADPDAVVVAFNEYISKAVARYMAAYLDNTDPLIWNIFQAAYRASVFPVPNEMLRKTLRLWVACRFLESKWRCWSETGWADEELLAMNPKDPFYKDIDSLPPYIDYQIASIIIQRVLSPLRKDVLRILQTTFNTHSPKEWFATFLTSFILLQNYEMQVLFQRQFAERRNARRLFTPGFDWTAPRVRRMARLDPEQSAFMAQCRDVVVRKGKLPPLHAITVLLTEREVGWGGLAVKEGCVARCLPPSHDWPAQMTGDLVWDATSFQSANDYTLMMTDAEVAEVKAGLRHFNELGLYGSEVTPETFPLPTLGPKLRQAAVDVHFGRGFVLVRGINPDEFSPEDNVLIFLGISTYIGVQRGRQDEDGNMLTHIRNARHSKTPQRDRPTRYSSRPSTFHTDTFADILALQTLTPSTHGGRNLLASSWTIYNALSHSHPHLVPLLSQPNWPFDSRGSFLPPSTRPLLHYHQGRMILNFAREPLVGLEGVERAKGVGVLSAEQMGALEVIEEVAGRVGVVVEGRRGDVLFVNNHGVVHSREGFEEGNGGEGRYLMRMWLRNPEMAWGLPGALREGWERIYGEGKDGVEEQWNVVDVPRVVFRLSERLTS
ncbi:hypothetical protein C8A05DRAFT_46842 [Staphylotrichum tortipilum]|uniref:TauD/TfdA-like domain-containing protein n=1 Tax=Staphylotrichum tortipilum TaxID=2831512 RepID=A0AAN6RPU2_9PEZI|nr:hypothetical protein C8A05DRAFT_46842 [Staphylotrichum longicolle]